MRTCGGTTLLKAFCKILLSLCLLQSTLATDWPATTQSEIESAHTSASNGDRILVSGSISFTTTTLLTKSVSLIGDGTNTTTLANNVTGQNPMIIYRLAADAKVRVSGITFDGNGKPGLWFDNQNSGTAPMTDNRVDHCTFRDCGTASNDHALKAAGYIYGVVDHCGFYDNIIHFEFDDRDDAAWARSPYPGIGTTNCWTMEDCYFESNTVTDVLTYTSNGGRLIFRNNVVVNNQSPGTALVVDCHGNNEMIASGDLRGTIFMQWYNNTWSGRADFQLRGGHMLVFSNTFTSQPFTTILGLTEEEFCRNGLINPAGYSDYPADDMLTNSFFWANTRNGSALAPHTYCDEPDPDGDMIEINRDWWERAPQSGDSANVFPLPLLTYPHPRVTADDGGGGSSTRGNAHGYRANVGTVRSP